jgi:hypothetical protein
MIAINRNRVKGKVSGIVAGNFDFVSGDFQVTAGGEQVVDTGGFYIGYLCDNGVCVGYVEDFDCYINKEYSNLCWFANLHMQILLHYMQK